MTDIKYILYIIAVAVILIYWVIHKRKTSGYKALPSAEAHDHGVKKYSFGGFTYSVPESWTEKNGGPNSKSYSMESGMLVVFLQNPHRHGIDDEKFQEQFIKQASANYKQCHTSVPRKVNINGLQGFRYLMTGQIKIAYRLRSLKIDTLVFQNDTSMINFGFISYFMNGGYADNEKVFSEIMQSIQSDSN